MNLQNETMYRLPVFPVFFPINDVHAEKTQWQQWGNAAFEQARAEDKMIEQTALALEKLTAAYVEFSAVGEEADPSTLILFGAGINAYHPRKLLHYEKSGRYPQSGESGPYMFQETICHPPVSVRNRGNIQDLNLFLSFPDENGNTSNSWTFVNAYPVKWRASDLNSQESELLIESIEFAYHYFNIPTARGMPQN